MESLQTSLKSILPSLCFSASLPSELLDVTCWERLVRSVIRVICVRANGWPAMVTCVAWLFLVHTKRNEVFHLLGTSSKLVTLLSNLAKQRTLTVTSLKQYLRTYSGLNIKQTDKTDNSL